MQEDPNQINQAPNPQPNPNTGAQPSQQPNPGAPQQPVQPEQTPAPQAPMNVQDMGFGGEIKRAINIAIFKKEEMMAAAGGGDAHTKMAYIIIAIGAGLGFIGGQLFPIKVFGATFKTPFVTGLVTAALSVVMAVVGIYLMSFIAQKIFGGKAEHKAFFRAMAYGMVINWLSIIPALSAIAGLWGIVLIVVILMTVHRISVGGAIGTLIVGGIAAMILSFAIAPVLGLVGLSTGGFGGFGGGQYMDSGSDDGEFDFKNFEINIPGNNDHDGGSIRFEEGGMVIEDNKSGESMEIRVEETEEGGKMVIEKEGEEEVLFEVNAPDEEEPAEQ